MRKKQRLIVLLGITLLAATIMIMGGGGALAEIAGSVFKLTWDDDTASTETVSLRASGTLKSIMVNVPAADSCRMVLEDHETGYRYASETLTVNSIQRVSLSGEISGMVDVKIYTDPTTSAGCSIVGQILIEK